MTIQLAVGAVCVGVALFGAAHAHAQPDTNSNVTFLRVLQDQGISATSGGATLIDAGHLVCTLRINGKTEMQTVKFIQQDSQLDDYDAGYFVGAAEQAYCPAYFGGNSNEGTNA